MKSLRRKIQEFQKKNKNFRSSLIEELLKNLIKGPFNQNKIDSFLHINNSDLLEEDIFIDEIKISDVLKTGSSEIEDIKKKFDLVFCNNPYGKISSGISPLKTIDLLEENGICVHLMPGFSTVFKNLKGKKFLKSLNDKNFKVLSVIEMPNNFLYPETARKSSLVFFSKQNGITQTLFVRYEEDNIFSKQIANFQNTMITFGMNLLLNKEERLQLQEADKEFGEINSSDENLFDGIERDIKDFENFEFWIQKRSIKNLNSEYKDYEFVKLRKVSKVNLTRDTFEESENAIYIPNVGKTEIKIKLPNLDSQKKPHNYFQVIPNTEVLIKDFLIFYLESTLGQQALKLEFEKYSDQVIKRLRKEDILNFEIPLPTKDLQLNIIENYHKLNETQDALTQIKENLYLNPLSSSEQISKLNNIYESTLELTAPEIIYNQIKQGESKKIEFKQTFSTDIKTKEQNDAIKYANIKTVAGFMNVDGGTLFVGVDDDSNIVGLDLEVGTKKWKNIDEYVTGVKNTLKSHIGLDAVQNCEFNHVKIKGKDILKIDCRVSSNPVFVDKDKLFVRVGPSTEQLKGPEIVTWSQDRLKQID